jgi:hypothetical protein
VKSSQNPAPNQLELFRERLPAKPYHTDDLRAGVGINRARYAALCRYIQPNGPTHKWWLVYDIDREGAAIDWNDRNCPPPSIVAMNPANGHAHLIYGLETSVRTAPDAKSDPIRYAGAVDCALRYKLDADPRYSGLICKNPLHPHWRVETWEPKLYTLNELDSWLDLTPAQDKRKRLDDYGMGRNCNLFDMTRLWAYKAIRQGWPSDAQWFAAVEQRALMYNAGFAAPLDHAEVRHIAKSVTRYTLRKFSAAGFSAWQAAQGRKGGLAKGRALRAQLRPQIIDLIGKGCSEYEIARLTGQSRQTINNWIRAL